MDGPVTFMCPGFFIIKEEKQMRSPVSYPAMRHQAGMTLLEVMVAVTICMIVMGMLFSLFVGMTDTARLHEEKSQTVDEARRAMILLERELLQASRNSITIQDSSGASAAAGPRIVYQIPVTNTTTNVGITADKHLNLGNNRMITTDTNDTNQDGLSTTQMVLTGTDADIPNGVRVLANNILFPDGIWFQRDGTALRITIQTRGMTRQGLVITSHLSETILPRNP